MAAKGPDSGKELIISMIKGGEKACTEYCKLSGGYWLNRAPEYFLTTYAASALRNFGSTSIGLEVSVNKSRKEANAVRNGRPSQHDRRNGRYDIVLYRADDKPRGCVEVKSSLYSVDRRRLVPDFVRLCSTLNSKERSSIQFSGLLFFASVAAPQRGKDTEEERLNALLMRINDLAKESSEKYNVSQNLLKSKIRVDPNGGGAWCIGCVVFSNNGTGQNFR